MRCVTSSAVPTRRAFCERRSVGIVFHRHRRCLAAGSLPAACRSTGSRWRSRASPHRGDQHQLRRRLDEALPHQCYGLHLQRRISGLLITILGYPPTVPTWFIFENFKYFWLAVGETKGSARHSAPIGTGADTLTKRPRRPIASLSLPAGQRAPFVPHFRSSRLHTDLRPPIFRWVCRRSATQ